MLSSKSNADTSDLDQKYIRLLKNITCQELKTENSIFIIKTVYLHLYNMIIFSWNDICIKLFSWYFRFDP